MIPSGQEESALVLAQAQRALEDFGRFFFGNQKLEGEFCECDLFDEAERYNAIDIALGEIDPADRAGPLAPGHISSHPPFEGLPMYAFCWNSTEFRKRMYLKFGLALGSGRTQLGGPKLVVYSFHETRTLGSGDR